MTISRKAAVLATALATMAILSTGCDVLGDNDRPTTRQQTEEAARELRTRPSLEDAEAGVHSVMERIAGAATELVPTMRFEWVNDRMASDCTKPFDKTNGRIVYMRNLMAQEPFPEDRWPEFFSKAQELAGTLGATWSQTVRGDQSTSSAPAPSTTPAVAEFGRHDVNFYNPDTGTSIRIRAFKATVISATVGCHLPKDKFDTPIPPER